MSDSDSSIPSSAAAASPAGADAPAELRHPSSPLLTTAERRQLRLRRVRSVSRAQEIVTEDEKQRRAQPDKP